MKRVRDDGLVSQGNKDDTLGWIVTEMLVAFHPYFSDEYKPIDKPDNIEVLIRDTRSIIVKAQELDDKLRSAGKFYDLILGQEGAVVEISDVPSPSMQSYVVEGAAPKSPTFLHDSDLVALIVVPGLVKCNILEHGALRPILQQDVVRHAWAFTQLELFTALRT